jgi:ferric-dicitrate binding protein FerR (iron transport regulator)
MTTPRDELPPEDAGIDDLLRRVGARDEPSPEIEREVYAAVHAEWRSLVQERRQKRRFVAWGMAASFALVMIVGIFGLRLMTAPADLVASVSRLEGSLTVDSQADPSRQVGERISVGERLSTDHASRAALTIGSDLSLRLDHDTIVRFASNDSVALEAGAIYVDDPPSGQRTPLTVESRAGSVQHVGTQYLVRDLNSGIEVSVREGRVLVTNAAGANAGVAGEALHVTPTGEVSRAKVAPTDERWAWAKQTAPTFDINDRSLASFLEWFSRETGREVIYQTPVAREAADEAKLHGSIEGLDLDTALSTVLSTTKLQQYEAGSHRIGIRLAAAAATSH